MGIRFATFVLLSLLSACEETDSYPLQRAAEVDYSATVAAAPVPQAARDTLYLHGSLNVRSAPSRQASLVRTAPRGEKVLLGPKDTDGWAPVYDETSDRPAGYLYRASGDVRASAPLDEMPAPRALSGGSRRARGGNGGYYTGPRGGCYTYSASGRKRYVDRSYCN